MPPPPAADGPRDDSAPGDTTSNVSHGSVYGHLVQARDIHGGVTFQAPQAPLPPPADVSLDAPRPATAVRGREELLATLDAALEAGAPVPHVLTGPGGFGKTTVAAALAGRARAGGWTVFWVRPGNVAASMVEAAVEMGGSRQEAEQVKATRHQAARWVWRHLDSAPRPWLLVIDNADRPEELDPENRPGDQVGWMRASPGGFVLVTSRVDDPLLWSPARVHRLGELDPPAAAAALTDHAGLTDLAGADELSARLGRVPLALSLAGRILATHRVLFPDAHALLAHLSRGVGALDTLAAPFVTGTDADRGLLSGVWELSLRLVRESEPEAAPLLRLLSVLGADATPVPLRRLPLSELNGRLLDAVDDAGLARAVNALVVHGLVTVGQQGRETLLRLHPLVSETVRAGLAEDDLRLVDAADHLLALLPDQDLVFEFHARSTAAAIRRRLWPDDPAAVLDSMVPAARSLTLLGLTDHAHSVLSSATAGAEESLGGSHPATLRAKHALADVLRAQNRLGDAEEVYSETAGIRGAVLGPGHPETLSSRHQVALMAGLRGDLDTAEAGFRSVLDAHRGAPEAPTALQASENLAHVRLLRGDAVAAEERFREISRIRTNAQGERHIGTLATLFSLAQALRAGGRREEAAEVLDRVARAREEILGGDHPLTLAAREARENALRAPGAR